MCDCILRSFPLLFQAESIAAFREEAAARGVPFPAAKEIAVSMKPIVVADKL
jgi:hypothetical protein